MVTPGSEDELAALFVEGVIGDVDLADCFKDASGLPVNFAIVVDDGTELAVITIDAIGSGTGDLKYGVVSGDV